MNIKDGIKRQLAVVLRVKGVRMSDREYLQRRAAQEDELASVAQDKEAAVIHSAMAAEYRRRLLEIETERQFRAMRTAG